MHCEIKALLDRAKATDDQERNEPELDIPAEISRREKRLEAIQAAKARLEARQREADQARGRSEDDGHAASPSGWLGQGRWLVQTRVWCAG